MVVYNKLKEESDVDMIRRNHELRKEFRENVRGGQGNVTLEHILEPEDIFNKGRLFAKITVEPGCGVGEHQHTGEMEGFYILRGEATVEDNGQTFVLKEGDVLYTHDGGSHSLYNSGKTTLEYLAIIISK